jgi:hypothetical protein
VEEIVPGGGLLQIYKRTVDIVLLFRSTMHSNTSNGLIQPAQSIPDFCTLIIKVDVPSSLGI